MTVCVLPEDVITRTAYFWRTTVCDYSVHGRRPVFQMPRGETAYSHSDQPLRPLALLFCKTNVTVTNVGWAGDLVQFIDEVERFLKQIRGMLLSLEYCQPLLGLMTEEVAQCHVGSHYVQDSPANCCCSRSPSCLTARIVF